MKNCILKLAIIVVIFLSANTYFYAQSTNQNSPTPITANEIKGEIKPRAVGDPRLTNYFYTFKGNQGDVFLNVVTNNLDGDIDIFKFNDLEPLTKIPVFSGVSDNETGRVIYLRKAEKLILRVQGRPPNDDNATFQIKFAGSFVPMQSVAENNNTVLPEIDTKNQGEARVNSVGTIIEVFPKPVPTSKETISTKISGQESEEIEEKSKEIIVSTVENKESPKNTTTIEIRKETDSDSANEETKKDDQSAVNVAENVLDDSRDDKPKSSANPVASVIITDNLEDAETSESIKSDDDRRGIVVKGKSDADKEGVSKAKDSVIFENDENSELNPTENADEDVEETKVVSETTEIQPVEAGKLANITLVVNFKDGKKFKRSMDKVTWFNVDKGILTIVTDDGTVLKFSMLDVDKMTFESGK